MQARSNNGRGAQWLRLTAVRCLGVVAIFAAPMDVWGELEREALLGMSEVLPTPNSQHTTSMVAERQVNVSRKANLNGKCVWQGDASDVDLHEAGRGDRRNVAGRAHTKKRLCTPSATNWKLT
jgi:hypothetical protein